MVILIALSLIGPERVNPISPTGKKVYGIRQSLVLAGLKDNYMCIAPTKTGKSRRSKFPPSRSEMILGLIFSKKRKIKK